MLNTVQLIGRVARELKLEHVQSKGDQIAKVDFTLAVNHHQKQENVDFIPCVVFRTQAENLFKYIKKGSKIFVSGKISINNYTDKNGDKRSTTKVIAQQILYLDNKPKDQA